MDSSRPLSIERYLNRIRCPAATAPTARFLAELQAHHLHSVPYENLDILAGRPLSLDIATLYGKLVEQERGGYCFELNALFAWLLRALGYEVVDCVARFWRDEERLPPKRRHHVLKVRAEGWWFLVDVGVGGVVPVQPLVLEEDVESIQGQECYRLARDARFDWILQERRHGQWSWVYSFTEEPQEPCDFAFAHFWCLKADESVFRKSPMIAIRTIEGRNSVAGNEVRLFRPGGVEAFTPKDAAEWRESLHQHFGIRLAADFPWALLGQPLKDAALVGSPSPS